MRTSNANQLVIRSVMLTPTIEKNELMCVNEKECWINSIKASLRNQALLKDKWQAKKITKNGHLVLLGE